MMTAEALLTQIRRSPTVWHVVANLTEILKKQGYALFSPEISGNYPAGKFYTVRNGSCLIAFRIPEDFDVTRAAFRISAVHGDSPALRLKPEGQASGSVGRLSAEVYGGAILSTWLDRPLSLAGRVTVRSEKGLTSRLVDFARPMAIIPNTAPHLRDMKSAPDPRTDLVPVFSESCDFRSLLADPLQVDRDQIAGWDLFLTAAEPGTVFGPKGEWISSPRLDDLQCVYPCLDGFLSEVPHPNTVPMFALFDNEETGSLSYCGAAGTALADLLAGIIPDSVLRNGALFRSFFVSADNAHGLHPNHPELSDPDHAPRLNGGVVLKYNASQRYMTDGFSGSVFSELCRKEDVPVQFYANRSDLRGGSTLGNLSEAQVPVRGVDIGAAQWAMHSAVETAGAFDVEYLSKAMTAFYRSDFRLTEDRFLWN